MKVATCSDIKLLRSYATGLEDEVRMLHRRITEQVKEIAQLRGDGQADLELEVQLLNEKLALQQKRLFGDSSERRPKPEEAAPPKPRKERSRSGPRPQPELSIVDRECPFDEADRICPKCGEGMPDMAGQSEDSEYIDVIERRYIVVKQHRQKVRCGNCGHIDTALGADKIIPGGRYSPAFAVNVAVDKYDDHLPLHRQVRRMARLGLDIKTQTLWDQIDALAQLLKGSYTALVAYVLTATVIGIDETRWRIFGPAARKLMKKWWVWGVVGNGAVFYKIRPSRATEVAHAILGDYAGVIMADGYEVYASLVHALAALIRDGPGPVLANCWAHVRRKFCEAEPDYPDASEAIRLIGELYAVEREADRAEVPDEEARLELRARLRKERSAPIVGQLRKWMYGIKTLRQGALGKAIKYADGRWKRLTRFLEDPRIPLDNNAIERAFRSLVVGRNNHYGSQSERGTEVAAILYSLIESARLAGVNPVDYLNEAVRRAIANPADVFLPHQMKAASDAGE